MKYKIGDRVKIKSHDWYKSQGDYVPSWLCPCCGRVLTIDIAYTEGYAMKEVQGVLFQDRMIEGLAEGLTQEEFAVEWANFDFNKTMNDIIRKRREENMKRKEQTLEEAMLHTGVICPEGYEFKDENGNVIEAKKIVLEKKKQKYPTTYDECAEILGFKPIHGLALQLVVSSGFSISDTQICAFERNLTIRLEYFRKLLICRDAYWYCYAKENNMPFNWKPEWSSPNQEKFTIRMYDSYRHFGHDKHLHSVLAFPTAEMRDVFYGNFKELIEECKELL